MYFSLSLYIYIERERKREIYRYNVYTYIHTYIYIYIYIHIHTIHTCIHTNVYTLSDDLASPHSVSQSHALCYKLAHRCGVTPCSESSNIKLSPPLDLEPKWHCGHSTQGLRYRRVKALPKPTLLDSEQRFQFPAPNIL